MRDHLSDSTQVTHNLTNTLATTQTWDVWIVLAITGVVWGLLRLWSYPSPFPDESLRLLVEQTGAWPRLSPLAPLWNGLARWVASLNAEAMPARMQFAGQITLAVSTGLFYRVVVRFITLFLDHDESHRWSHVTVRFVGIGSALFLMSSPPIWRAAQSPHPAIFGLFLVVAATEAVLRYAEQRTLIPYLLWAALAGAGSVESPLVFLFLPAWIALLLWLPWGAPETIDSPDEDPAPSKPPWRWLTGGAVAAMSAMACVAYAVQTYNGTEGYAMRGFSRRLHVLQHFGWDYIAELRGAMPSIGWLIIVIGLLLPWLLTVTLARHVQNGDFGPVKQTLYGVAGIATVAQVMTIESLQIWSLLPSATFRVGACLISAMTFGLVAVAWLLEAERGFHRSNQNQLTSVSSSSLNSPFLGAFSGVVYLAVGGCMLGAAALAVSHRQEGAERAALRVFQDYTSAVVEDAAECEWIITDGIFDHALRLEAWRAGSHLQPICILSSQPGWVLHATERRLPDPESRILFSISPQVMLREWLAARPEQTQKVAAQLGYDLWIRTSIKLSPQRTLFLPIAPGAATAEPDVLMERHRPFWNTLGARLAATHHVKDGTLVFHLRSIRNNIARVANEVGVLAQDEAKDECALEAYTTARRLNPENISAALNVWLLAHSLDRNLPSALKELPAEIKRLSMLLGKSSVLGVIRLHGTIRTSHAMAVLAAGQLLSGDRYEALARVDAALRLLPKAASNAEALRATAANLQWLTGDTKGARESYLAILLKKPTDINALFGLAVLEASEGGLDTAVSLIDSARNTGASPVLCDQLHATLCLEANAPSAAHTILEPYVKQNTRNATFWYLWGWTAMALQDKQAYKQAQAELQRFPNARGSAESLASKAAMRAGDLTKALHHAKAALDEQPNNPNMLETTLRLCLTLGDYKTAEPYARNLLSINSGHALARYLLGSQLLLDGDAAAAEPLLMHSAATVPRAETLNNLACAQLLLNKLDDARVTAKAAVELAPERTEIWDTVAAVALAQGRPLEAETAARQALLLNPDAPEAWLRVAEALAAGGNLAEARSCLDCGNLTAAKELGPEIRSRLARLQTVL